MTTGLSGNEMFCLNLKGYDPGNLVVGNSVHSLGVMGGIASGLNAMLGGEVSEITRLIQDGRSSSYDRMHREASSHGGIGITGVSSELIMHQGNIEFLSVGSCVHTKGAVAEQPAFSTSSDGQELYCQLDCGFKPLKFVFGNVAYSVGLGGGLTGTLRALKRGEVHEFSQIFRTTRHLALERVTTEARQAGANAVLGIETSILPFFGVQEMLMLGTAANHPLLVNYNQNPVTSDLTNQEMWNVIHMGYMPVRLVMGVSVYSLGVVGGFLAGLQSLGRGELTNVSSLIYEARENAIAQIHQEAAQHGADAVLGIKTYVYQLGNGLIEFLAIGTAVRKVPGLTTHTPQLPPQAVIVDRDTFVSDGDIGGINLNAPGGRGGMLRKGSPLAALIVFVFIIAIMIIQGVLFHHSRF